MTKEKELLAEEVWTPARKAPKRPEERNAEDAGPDGDATQKDLIRRWILAHPGGTAEECAVELGCRRSYVYAVAKEMGATLGRDERGRSKALFVDPEARQRARERGGAEGPKKRAVLDYLVANPGSTAKEAADAAGCTVAYVHGTLKTLDDAGKDRPRVPGAKETALLEWYGANPGAPVSEAATSAGASLGFAYAVRRAAAGRKGPTKAESIALYLEGHPGCTAEQCAEATGSSTTYVRQIAGRKGVELAAKDRRRAAGNGRKRRAMERYLAQNPHAGATELAAVAGASVGYASRVLKAAEKENAK